MRVTVIPADRWIRRDDVSANLPDWPFDDFEIHAIQWYDTEGEIEYMAKPKPPNKLITDFSILQPYLDVLNEYVQQQLLQQQQQEQSKELAEEVTPEDGNTPLPADEVSDGGQE